MLYAVSYWYIPEGGRGFIKEPNESARHSQESNTEHFIL